MNKNQPAWASDRRLDIVVFGPMGDGKKKSSLLSIREAALALLDEPEFKRLIDDNHIFSKEVHVPEGQNEQEITQNILGLLDSADLALFDLTPKSQNADRANVFYELALVHALGIPTILLLKDKTSVPFYARTSNQNRVANFRVPTLKAALRAPLREFLDGENRQASFTNDRVSQFYGLPIVDISAAVGLATGYYYNFISRLITEGGFIAHYPELIKHVIYVRPTSVNDTYENELELLKKTLADQKIVMSEKKLDPLPSDKKGMLWFYHVNGIVIDLPRTIYPLQRSPRLLSLHSRHRDFPSRGAEKIFRQRVIRMENNLLNRVESAIDFQIRHDGPRVRAKAFEFATMETVAERVKILASNQ